MEQEEVVNWKFWENGNKPKEKQTLCIIEEYLQKYDDKLHEMTEHIHNNEDLVQKSLRLQYKSNQEITKKLEQINEKIDKTEYYSKKHSDIQHDKDNLIKERNFLLENYIQWLDDIDLIYDKLNAQGQEYWISLFESWQKQVLSTLEAVGIVEVDILDKGFNPVISESVSTKKKEENKEYKPYEVVNVLQRGFIYNDGTLLRKAKVITIEEGEIEDNEV